MILHLNTFTRLIPPPGQGRIKAGDDGAAAPGPHQKETYKYTK